MNNKKDFYNDINIDEVNINFNEIFKFINRNKKLILLFGIVGFFLGSIYGISKKGFGKVNFR